MIKKTIFCISILAFTLTVVAGGTAFAAATLSVSPSGNGTFVLNGTSVENVASMDITVTYDAQSLANPRVEQGALISGALMAVNGNIPGTVRMGIIRTTPIQGSGIIATLAFDKKGDSGGMINTLNATLSSINGKPLPVVAQVLNQAGNKETDATASNNQPTQEDEKRQPLSLDANVKNKDLTPVTPVTVSAVSVQEQGVAPQEPVVPAAEEVAAPEKEVYANRSVLDGFRDLTGERTVKALLSLFEHNEAVGFHQEPLIGIADGKLAVKAAIISDSADNMAPGIVVKGARLVSVKKAPEYTNTWIVELVPEKNADEASLTVSMEKIAVIYPITVAPRVNVDLDKSGKVTEADFNLFLKKRDMSKEAAFDMNGDGKKDYLDDYIFTANYIEKIKRGAAGK